MENSPIRPLETTTSRRGFLGLVGSIGLAAGIAGSLSACAGKPASSGPAGGDTKVDKDTIVAGISYELGTNGFDPLTTTSALTLAANWHTMEGLTEVLPTGDRKAYAALGKELPKKIDDTTYEVTLRDGAVFHDGSKVTTDDVVFSFERVMNPYKAKDKDGKEVEKKSLYASFIDFIAKVEKKDDKTVVIKTKYPFTLVAERLAVVKIVPKAAVEKDAKAFDANPIGTGAYKMTDNSAQSKKVVFEAFADYKGPHPAKAKKMIWEVMPDTAVRQNALTSKKVMAMDAVPDEAIKALEAKAAVESVQGFGLLFAMFNCGSAPFKEAKNRQGVLYALDIAKVCANVYKGNATPASCFVQDTHPSYKKAKNVYAFNVEKAKALFAETGLKEIRMLCTDHGWVKPATVVLKESLEAAGLVVKFEQKKSADVYTTIDGKPEAYDLVIAPGDPSVFGNDVDLLMRWWYANDTWTDQRMHWKGQESFTKVQELLEASAKLEGEAQKAKWGECFDVISEAVPLYPLFHRKVATAYVKEALTGFQAISLTGLSFIDVAPAAK